MGLAGDRHSKIITIAETRIENFILLLHFFASIRQNRELENEFIVMHSRGEKGLGATRLIDTRGSVAVGLAKIL